MCEVQEEGSTRTAAATKVVATGECISGTGMAEMHHERRDSLVELMKGSIEVQSQKGVGTQFHFTVCCGRAQPQLEEKGELKGKKRKMRKIFPEMVTPKNILVVEDNKINQKILATYLNGMGHYPSIANNGLEAVRLYKKQEFDIVFMDIEMPTMGGLEVTRRIRGIEQKSHRSPTFIIGLSGNARTQQVQEALRVGMNDYLTKPYHREDIFDKIKGCSEKENICQSIDLQSLPSNTVEEASGEPSSSNTETISTPFSLWNQSVQKIQSLPEIGIQLAPTEEPPKKYFYPVI